MALDLLEGIQSRQPVVHTMEHDLESFVWVMAYAVLRKLVDTASAIGALAESRVLYQSFQDGFGELRLESLIQARELALPFRFRRKISVQPKLIPFRDRWLSRPLQAWLYETLRFMVSRGTSDAQSIAGDVESLQTQVGDYRLTYDLLIASFQNVIAMLEADPTLDVAAHESTLCAHVN